MIIKLKNEIWYNVQNGEGKGGNYMEGKREFDLVIEEISDEINVMTGASFSGSCSTSTSCGSTSTSTTC